MTIGSKAGTSQRKEQFIFVVFRSTSSIVGQELKSLLFATEDPSIAYGERDRLNDERTSDERYSGGVSYKAEKVPLLARRRSRHPFQRGAQRELFNPDAYEKDGNVDETKTRGRIVRAPQSVNHH